MTPEHISKNMLKDISKLRQKKFRDQDGKFLISGERAIMGALSAKDLSVDVFLVAEPVLEKSLKLIHNYPILRESITRAATVKEFQQITDEKTPQGLAIIVKKPKLVEPVIPADQQCVLYLDRVSDPGNLGTIIRTAAWFGFTNILLSPGSADPFQGKAVRASAGLITGMNISENINTEILQTIKTNWNYSLVSSVLDKGTPLWKLTESRGLIILFGSEARGLSAELIAMSDLSVEIPGFGFGESLNLGVAAGCFLYHISSIKKGR